MAAWKNYGGDKTWPSPQGWDNDEQWAGPPDGILDTGRYQVDEFNSDDKSATILMTSPGGSPTGVQITRRATIFPNSARVKLDLTFRNISQRKIRWSIWDVVQLNAERKEGEGNLTAETSCVVTAPINPESRFEPGFYVMFGDPTNPQWHSDKQAGLFFSAYKWEIGKVGLDTRAGWAAFANQSANQVFAVRYTVLPGEYPDNGSAVEFWTVGRGKVANLDYGQNPVYLMEVEVLSPFLNIEPGQNVSIHLEWGACRCQGPVVDVNEAGCAAQRLAVKPIGDFVHVTGSFGVFDRGQLQFEWLDRSGGILGVIDLGPVSPLGLVTVEHYLSSSPAAGQARLIVLNGCRQLLATAEF